MYDKTINKLYCGDNLQIMHEMSDESVDLIYLDPPFFSGKNYEVIWGDKAEIRSFDDRFEGGIMVYIEWMKDRLKEMHRILKPTGSIYLHVDWHAVHYLKVEMDRIFGMNNFRNEITWKRYGGVKNNATKKFSVQVDNILYYVKGDKYTFYMPYRPLSESHVEKKYIYKDDDGRKYAKSWGRTYQLTGENKKLYLDETKGRPITSLWDEEDLTINTSSSESLGYPTQKPEALLERIIKASSNPGDIMFDPFCGCGTSIAVAQRLERNFIGIDISPIACKVVAGSKRVTYSIHDIIGLPRTPEEIKKMKSYEFQNWVCQKMSAKNTSPNPEKDSGADGGVDGIIHSPLLNPKYHGCPIQVKRQTQSVGINTVKNFFASMHDVKKDVGFIVALSFGSGAKEQVAKYKNEGSVIIHLLTVEDIVNAQDLDEITSKLRE